MGVFTFHSEDASPVPAAKLFKGLALKTDELFPKTLSEHLKSIELLQGDGGPGSIRKLNYVEDGKLKYVKHEIEEVDQVNLKVKYSAIEGDILGDKLEKISYDMTYVPSPDGGAICKSITKVYSKGDIEVTDEQFQAERVKTRGLLKPVEDYLLANDI